MPASFAALLSTYKDSNNQLIFHFKGCFGPSAANLIGRFAHLNKTLAQELTQLLDEEQQQYPDAVLAEIAHLPAYSREGNVLARPALRPYEIPLMTDSVSSNLLPLTDLMVYIVNDTVCLWSKSLQKRVIPRLSSAHNYRYRGLGSYRFLAMLQSQNCVLPKFSLGSVLNGQEYSPRICVGNIIVKPRKRYFLFC